MNSIILVLPGVFCLIWLFLRVTTPSGVQPSEDSNFLGWTWTSK